MAFEDDTLYPLDLAPPRSLESEVERRIALLRQIPGFSGSGWSPSVSCRWLSNEVKVVDVTIFFGRYHKLVFTVSRESDNVLEAINKAFNAATEKIEKLYKERDTGLS